MGLSAYARRLQTLERLLPLRVRLPLRYRAQQVLRSLEPEIAQIAELCLAATLDDIGSVAYGADIAQMKHETLATRIFRS